VSDSTVPPPRSQTAESAGKWLILGAAVWVCTAAAAVVYVLTVVVPRERAQAVANWRVRLEATLDDRGRAISEWAADALRGAAHVAREAAAGRIGHPGSRAGGPAVALVDRPVYEAVQGDDFAGLWLFDETPALGGVVAGSPDPGAEHHMLARRTLESAAPALSLAAGRDGAPPLALFAAGAEGAGGGALVAMLALDFSDWLFPLLARESAPTSTGETVLVGRAGGEVVYLSPLRHSRAAPGTLRSGGEPSGVPLAEVLAGKPVFGSFQDYRRVPVLAAARPLPGTPWALLAKVDASEALAEVRREAPALLLAGGALLLAFAASGVALWRWVGAAHYKALAAGKAEAAGLFEQGPDAGLLLENGTVLAANLAAGELFGAPPARLLGEKLWRLGPEAQPDGRTSESVLAERTAGTEEGGRRRFDWRLRRFDGGELDAEVSLSAHRSGSGRVLVWLRDVTAERAARARLQFLVEGSPRYFFYLQELDGSLSYVSPSVESITGRPVSAWLSAADWFATESPVNLEARARTIRHLRGELSVGPALVEVEHADGHPVLLEVYEFGRHAGGKLIGLHGVAHDVTQRARAEEALRRSEERFRTLVESLGEGVGIVDPDERVVFANPAAEAIFGMPPGTLVGRSLEALVTPESAAKLRTGTERRRGGATDSYDIEVVRPDGARRTVVLTATPHAEASGYAGAFVIFRDVTERRSIEAQLRHVQKLEAVGLLAGGIAHDFNNLLQAMLALAQVIEARAEDAGRVRALATEIADHVRRGAALARQLLLFSDRGTAHREVLDLGEVVRRGAELLRRLLPEHVALAVPAVAEPLPVNGDRGQLEQVLMNLTVNAAEAMPEGGSLVVGCGRAGGEAWLEVTDTGHGIPEDVRSRIFEPFFSTKRAGGGSGLGLAVAHGIVTGHGGRIDVTSAVGNGSTFRVTLPLAEAQLSPGAGAGEDRLQAPRGDGVRVLIVEDEPAAREGLAEALGLLGYVVTAVGSAEEAGLLPEQPGFDVLLTDYLLPGASGADLARGLADRWPGLRVVMMSGYTEDAGLREQVCSGAVRFLQKPFTIAAVARELGAAIADRHTG